MDKTVTQEKNVESANQVLLRAADCARICGISRRTWFRLAATTKTPASIRLGASPVWRRQDLDLWIALGCPSRKDFEARKEAEQC